MDRSLRLSSSPRVGARPGRSVIAVIGIDQYRAWPRLHNAVNDATGVVRIFTQLGFTQVIEPLLDGAATGEAIHRLVTADLASLTPDDSLVLLFAGHGHTHAAASGDVRLKTGYVIPTDGELPGDGALATWLRLDHWLGNIAQLPPLHILVILDSCHSGVALSGLHRWRDIAATAEEPRGSLHGRRSRRIITSALDDQIALDGGPYAGHSLFAGCLIEGMSGPLAKLVPPNTSPQAATGTELGLYVQRRVASYPYATQTPDCGAFDLDDRGEIIIPVLGCEPASQLCTWTHRVSERSPQRSGPVRRASVCVRRARRSRSGQS